MNATDLRITKALIPAAGRGLRSYPKSKHLPKGMFEIENRPILENTLTLLRDKMNIHDIFMIVGYQKEKIINYFKKGEQWGVDISYIDCPNPEEGIGRGILYAEQSLQEPFICILGDEY
ncbi:MAG: sugar phosphate nucleotidyltransferase, partial [Deltaproteobacteria bacterium]